MKLRKSVFIATALIICYQLIQAQSTFDLDKQLQSLQIKNNFPGFAVALIKVDSVIYSKGFGLANKVKQIPYTPETIQNIASVSKTFVGVAIVKAIELGYFNMETEINTLLPFKVINPKMPNEPIAVKHLVTHTSSIIDNDPIRLKSYNLCGRDLPLLGEFLKDYFVPGNKYYDIANFSNSKPGTQFSYSNIATALAAYLIEVRSGIAFNKFSEIYIFKPLGMNHTSWVYTDSLAKHYATLYVSKPDPAYQPLLNADGSLKEYECVTYPDGSLRTNMNDLLKFLDEMMKGMIGSGILLSKKGFDLLFSRQFTNSNLPSGLTESATSNMGIFWSWSRKGNIGHSGSNPGVTTLISINPYSRVGKIIMTNTEIEFNRKLTSDFLNILNLLERKEKSIKTLFK